MGLAQLKTQISVEEYLEGEKVSPVRHEYLFGEVYAMAGTSDNHNRICGNVYIVLGNHLRDTSCEPFIGDIKVRVSPEIYYYPDVLVSCEQEPEDSHFRNNPILIVEVLSDSTAQTDRREKLGFYTQIPSLQEYVVIDQKRPLIEVHRRHETGMWITHIHRNLDDKIFLSAIDLTISAAEIYRRVQFPPADSN